MDDDRVLTELWRVILVQPVIIASEVALLRDPELDGVVLHLDEVQTRGPQHGDQQRDQDNWHRVRGSPDPEPEGEYHKELLRILSILFTSGRIPQTSRLLSLSLVN